MTSPRPKNKQRINAIFNIVAGLFFFAAAFNLLTGQHEVNWMWLLVGIVFVVGGIWGLRNP